MNDNNPKVNTKNSDIEFLNSLLQQQTQRQPARHTSMLDRTSYQSGRNTGAISTRRETGAISTRRETGTISTRRETGTISTRRNTGAISTKYETGTISTKYETGTISTKRNTGAISTKHETGTISTKRNTGAISTKHETGITLTRTANTSTLNKRPTGTIARYSIEDEDIYHSYSGNSSVIYTAGTNLFGVILIAIIVWLTVSISQTTSNQSIVSDYSPGVNLRAVAQIIGIQLPEPPVAPAAKSVVIPPGESSILGAPTVTAAQIDAILQANNSPAVGTGAIWVEAGLQYGIDPAFALAFFMHESSYGTNPSWAGIKPDGTTTHNVGNIICAGYKTCFGRFRDYADWRTGIYDWYRLIAVEYVQWRGLATVEGILPVYAPAFENDVPRYVNVIKYAVAEWRQANTITP